MPNEQIIDGILHFEHYGMMFPYCQQELTRMLIEARKYIDEQIVAVPITEQTGCDEA